MTADKLVRKTAASIAALGLAGALGAGAQEGYDPPTPAEEPSSMDTLFDQSDLGNVVQAARASFDQGVRYRKKAEKLEGQLAETPAEKIEKVKQKIEAAYKGAEEAFVQAIQTNPKLLAAYSELGAVLRHRGRAEEAVRVHAAALRREPGDAANLKGWAASLLALDYLGDVTNRYTELAASEPEGAAILMDELKAWLAAKQADPGDVEPAAVQKLADWVATHETG